MRKSPALKLLDLVIEHEGHRQGHSWDRINHGRAAAIELAIRYGLRFDRGDFLKLAKDYAFGHWGGNDKSVCGESFYSLACGRERGRENASAAQAFEEYAGRKPFLVREKDAETPTRVHVGRQLWWYGEWVEVTSFNDSLGTFTACTYRDAPNGHNHHLRAGEYLYAGDGYRKILAVKDGGLTLKLSSENFDGHERAKVAKRLTISHDDVRDYHAARKLLAEINTAAANMLPVQVKSVAEWIEKRWPKLSPEQLTLSQLREIEERIPADAKAAKGGEA